MVARVAGDLRSPDTGHLGNGPRHRSGLCRRRDFEAIGGYREEMLCAEDVQFLLTLRRRGNAAGQRLTRLRRSRPSPPCGSSISSASGTISAWSRMRRAAAAGRAMSGFARRYWYDVRGG